MVDPEVQIRVLQAMLGEEKIKVQYLALKLRQSKKLKHRIRELETQVHQLTEQLNRFL
jgi:hypothetical protein